MENTPFDNVLDTISLLDIPAVIEEKDLDPLIVQVSQLVVPIIEAILDFETGKSQRILQMFTFPLPILKRLLEQKGDGATSTITLSNGTVIELDSAFLDHYIDVADIACSHAMSLIDPKTLKKQVTEELGGDTPIRIVIPKKR